MAADVGANDFTHPTYRAVWELVAKNGGPTRRRRRLGSRIRSDAADPAVSSAISALGVEPLLTAKEPEAAFVAGHVYRLQELTALRRIAELKSRLQRTNPVEQADRLQPDVRRAGRARAAPPHPARAGHGRDVRRAERRPSLRRSAAGERVLAWAESDDGEVLAGTRDALYLDGTRLAWEDVEAADWDRDTEQFRVVEVGRWGERRVEHGFAHRRAGPAARAGPRAGHGQRRAVRARARSTGRRGVRVIARRAPRGRPRRRAGSTSTTRASTPTTPRCGWPPQTALAAARDEVGLDLVTPPQPLANLCGLRRSPVAQLAEHSAVNRRVVGSSPTGGASATDPTGRRHRRRCRAGPDCAGHHRLPADRCSPSPARDAALRRAASTGRPAPSTTTACGRTTSDRARPFSRPGARRFAAPSRNPRDGETPVDSPDLVTRWALPRPAVPLSPGRGRLRSTHDLAPADTGSTISARRRRRVLDRGSRRPAGRGAAQRPSRNFRDRRAPKTHRIS